SGGLPSSPAKPADTAPAAPAVSTGQSSPVTSAAQTSTQDTPPAGENRAEVPAANTGETAPSTPEQHETETDRQTPAGVSETTGQSEPEQRPEQIPSLSAPAEQPDPTSTEISASAEPEDGIEKAPAQTSAAKWDGLPPALLIGLALAGLAALILIILLLSRRLHRSPNRAMARAASPAEDEPAEEPPPFTDHSAELASYAASQKRRTTPYDDRRPVTAPLPADYSGPVTLNLFVEDQNTFIGKRNIHSVKPGHTFTIGGGNSDYLIFLVPVPPAIGEIRVEGNNCTFTPRKPKYFPDIGSQQVSNCIGKTIRIVSDKNYELRFRFERYEDPLHALNKLLNSVKVPG
ncbi:MAG TPA: hypothetical protein DEQ14_12160, partial [Treponema sp.]|nr:hypothetical protein [Treponema sp.]